MLTTDLQLKILSQAGCTKIRPQLWWGEELLSQLQAGNFDPFCKSWVNSSVTDWFWCLLLLLFACWKPWKCSLQIPRFDVRREIWKGYNLTYFGPFRKKFLSGRLVFKSSFRFWAWIGKIFRSRKKIADRCKSFVRLDGRPICMKSAYFPFCTLWCKLTVFGVCKTHFLI